MLSVSGSTASAAEPKAVGIRKGEPAPFTGQLFPVERIIRLGEKAERCDFLRKDDRERLEEHHEINVGLLNTKCDNRVGAESAKLEVWKREAERRPNWEFWTHPAVLIPLTALGTWAILKARKDLN